MNRKLAVLISLLALASIASAQNFTTLSAAMTATQSTATVASATYVVLPSNPTGSGSIGAPTGTSLTILFADGEAMAVLAQGSSSTQFRISRGFLGTKAVAHLSAAKVWVGPENLFNVYNPSNLLSGWAQRGIGPVLATGTGSSLTLVPNNPIQHVTGTGSVKSLTAPDAFKITGGCLVLIPDAAFTTTTGGNITKTNTTAVAGQALTACYDPIAATWAISY